MLHLFLSMEKKSEEGLEIIIMIYSFAFLQRLSRWSLLPSIIYNSTAL